MLKGLRELIFENHYKWIGFSKKDSNYLLKKEKKKLSVNKKGPDPTKAKENYELLLKNKD